MKGKMERIKKREDLGIINEREWMKREKNKEE